MQRGTRLSAKERNELESLMEARNADGPLAATITRLHGFFTSVISGPVIMPSEWMPVVFGGADEDAWETMDQARRAMTLVMRFYNEVASDLQPGGRAYSPLIDRLGSGPDAVNIADDWCRGYLLGMSLRSAEWDEALRDRNFAEAFFAITGIASPETAGIDPQNRDHYDALLDRLPSSAVSICEWWRERLRGMPPQGQHTYTGTVRRAAPKISPNAPCPCGSGKKYKRCCSGATREVDDSGRPAIYRLIITLQGVRPAVWRRVELPGDATLAVLHRVLQIAMGWTNSHLHAFVAGGVTYAPDGAEFGARSSRGLRLEQLASRPGSRFVYDYDFGDGWRHDIVVESIAPAAAATTYPRLLGGARACPPEDVGGVGGYEDFVAAVRDERHPEHARMLEWNGPFDPAAFDAAGVEKAFARLAASAEKRRSRRTM